MSRSRVRRPLTKRMSNREIAGAAAIIAATLAIVVWTITSFSRSNPAPVTDGGAAPSGVSNSSAKIPLNVLWVGDSFPTGTGTKKGDDSQGEARLACRGMGWICNLDTQGGTGFIANGHDASPAFSPMGARLAADHAKYSADVVVIDSGRNDYKYSSAELTNAFRTYLGRVKGYYPKAKIVTIVPYTMASTAPIPVDPPIITEARRIGSQLIDPIAAGWVGAKQPKGLLFTDGIHPDPAGHEYVARELVKSFRALGYTQYRVGR